MNTAIDYYQNCIVKPQLKNHKILGYTVRVQLSSKHILLPSSIYMFSTFPG